MAASKIKALVTRQLDSAEIDSALGFGINPKIIPFIKIELISNLNISEALLKQYDGIIFSSVNAVRPLEKIKAGLKQQFEDGCRFFAVGGKTELMLKSWGIKAELPKKFDAQSLADLIIKTDTLKTLLYPCGNIRRPILTQRLRDNQITVHEVEVYRTIILEKQIDTRPYDTFVFFSPSAVEGFFKKNRPENAKPIFAIGLTTAAAIRKYCNNEVISADLQEAMQLFKQIKGYFNLK